MSSSMNVCVFTGRLGSDPEKRALPNGTKVAGFSLAVNGRKKDDPAIWLRCSAFGKLAEIIAEYATKGREVAVSGSLNVREWDDREGAKRTSVELNVDTFTMIGANPNKDQSGGGDGWGGNKQPAPQGEQEPWNNPGQSQAPSGW